MKKINIRIPLIVLFFLLEIMSLFLTIKSYINKEIKIAEEIYVTEKNMFSMFVETDNGYEEYLESNKFPEGYTINLEESKCLDTKGNVIEGILSGSGANVTVTSKTTSYCYLYFDIPPITVETLPNIAGSDLWDSILEDDGYRYVGTDPNNYVCFGYSNAITDCDFSKATNTDLYAYRIIGIFEDGAGQQHLKLIKKEALNTSYAWHNDKSTDTDWNVSDLYKGLNGSYFLTNTTYMPSGWTDKIAEWNYIATNTLSYENSSINGLLGIQYAYNTVSTIYLHEMNRQSKSQATCYFSNTIVNCSIGEWKNVPSKISLMYVSDYYLSLGNSALSYTPDANNTILKTGWMNITNNDSGAPSAYDWTSTRYGFLDNYYVWNVDSAGYANVGEVSADLSVRPVFYLTSDVELSGEGTTGSPYIIS